MWGVLRVNSTLNEACFFLQVNQQFECYFLAKCDPPDEDVCGSQDKCFGGRVCTPGDLAGIIHVHNIKSNKRLNPFYSAHYRVQRFQPFLDRTEPPGPEMDANVILRHIKNMFLPC